MEGPAEVGAWAMEQLEQLAKDGPFGEGRVQIGVGFDQLGHNPKEFIVDILTRVRKFGAKIITMHMARGPPFCEFIFPSDGCQQADADRIDRAAFSNRAAVRVRPPGKGHGLLSRQQLFRQRGQTAA